MGAVQQVETVVAYAVVEERLSTGTVNIARELIETRAYRNSLIWADESSWVFGLYKGNGDTRLWVPRRCQDGSAHPTEMTLNLRHPIGNRTLNIIYGLALGVFAGLWIIAGMTIPRW